VLVTAVGIFITGFSSILTGLNFIVTIHTMRAPGLTWFRLPLFIWSNYAASLIMVLGTPVVAVTLLLVALERGFHIGIFRSEPGRRSRVVPAPFLVLLASGRLYHDSSGLGVISELVAGIHAEADLRVQSGRYGQPRHCGFSDSWFGDHHMFVSGQSVYASLVFSFLSYAVAIPSAVKVFNWTATLYKGSNSYQTPMLYAFGFIVCSRIGGLTGLFVAALGWTSTYTIPTSWWRTSTTSWWVARSWPIWAASTSGGPRSPVECIRSCPQSCRRWWCSSASNLTFSRSFCWAISGCRGAITPYPEEFQVLNVMSTAGASILAIGYALPMAYLLWSLKWGKHATANPWGAKGLEWETSSPPPTANFDVMPEVHEPAYAYSGRRTG